MLERPKYEGRQRGVVIMFIITLVIVVMALTIHFISNRTSLISPEYNTSNASAHWERYNMGESAAYLLTRNANVSLVITCRKGQLTTQDLTALTILRVVKHHEIRPIFVMGIDGRNWKVPIINDHPNPTQEDIDFLSALAKADWVSFVVDNVRYTWPTANQTELSQCVDLDYYKNQLRSNAVN